MRKWFAAAFGLLLVGWPSSPVAATAPTPQNLFVVSAGRKIAVHVYSGRSPVIVLDAGGGLDSSYWSDLAPQLAKITGSEVITYDRPGMGASDEAPGAWNVVAARNDLARVLERLHATHRVILVSHSLAGEIAVYLVEQHPGWFASGVLVDANVPDFFTDQLIATEAQALAPEIAAARSGPQTKAARQLVAVADSFVATSKAFHRQAWPGSVPVVVIVSEKTPFDDLAAARAWKDAHAAFAAREPNRTLVLAAGSSHDVAHDRPDVIVTAVSEAVSAARKTR